LHRRYQSQANLAFLPASLFGFARNIAVEALIILFLLFHGQERKEKKCQKTWKANRSRHICIRWFWKREYEADPPLGQRDCCLSFCPQYSFFCKVWMEITFLFWQPSQGNLCLGENLFHTNALGNNLYFRMITFKGVVTEILHNTLCRIWPTSTSQKQNNLLSHYLTSRFLW
jgi:hypothetical protein